MTSSGLKAGSGMNDLLIYNSSQESHVTSKGSLYPAKLAFSIGMGKVRISAFTLINSVVSTSTYPNVVICEKCTDRQHQV